MNQDKFKLRVAYLHFKGIHPTHGEYAKELTADFFPCDHFFPYYDAVTFKKTKKYISFFALLFFFPYRKYDAILTDGPDIFAVFLKKISFNRLKLISTQGNPILPQYFNGRFSPKQKKIIKDAFQSYDLIICLGNIQKKLAEQICENKRTPIIKESFNGVPESRRANLSMINYNANSKKIISISHNRTNESIHIKGIDIMLKLFKKIYEYDEGYSYYHLGIFEKELLDTLKKKLPDLPWHRTHFCRLGRY